MIMTRKEAIKTLEYLASCSYVDEFEPEEKEALKIAIEVLKQEPCEDAISREYLVEHIKACWNNGRPKYSPDLSELLSWIDDVPLVQPKPIECEDVISRQAVQDYIAKYLSQYLYEDVREAVEVIDEYIGELPSVKPQEPILDKVRAKINELSSYAARFNGGDFAIHIDKEKVLEIIDKYRSES